MSKLNIYDIQGKTVGDFELVDTALSAGKGTQAVRDAVVAIMAGRRAGTASTLSKGEVAGSNKKPWKQKGLGRARAGYRQSPVWRGGGVAFGPHPRSYAQKVNKKVMKLAFNRIFADAVSEGHVKVLDKLAIPEPKTKLVAGILKKLGIKGSVLVIDNNVNPDVAAASRNIPGLEVVEARNVNVYQLMKYNDIVITRSAMDLVSARMDGGAVEEPVIDKTADEGLVTENAE